MEKPKVFTDEEIDRFRQDLAAGRAPGAHEPGRWSVSPLNRREDVVGRLPERIRLRDGTLRSIEVMPGVVAPESAKQALLTQLVSAGVGEVVTAGGRGRDVEAMRAEIALIKSVNPDCRATCPLIFTAADLDRAHAAGYDAVQIWVPPWGEASVIYEGVYAPTWRGEDWRSLGLPRNRAEILARACTLTTTARERGLKVSTPLLMVSYLTPDGFAETCSALAAAGATELTLFDGPGSVGPEAFAHLVRAAKEVAPEVAIGLHPHNSFGLAVACAVAAARAGAEVIEVSVNGYCGGPGNADLAATVVAFEALYGVRTGVAVEKLTALARQAAALTGYDVAWNHPVTGRETFGWGGMDFITQDEAIDPLLHNCVEPTWVGNQRRVPLTPESGPFTMLDKLNALGVEATREEVEEVLRRSQAVMRDEGRLLDDEEIGAIAAQVTGQRH